MIDVALWSAGGFAAVGALVAPRGIVAHIASAVARPRTAAFLAERSATADQYAAAIAAGEAEALAARDRLALAAGCAEALRALIPAESPAVVWWDKGRQELDVVPVAPSVTEELALAACLQYAADLAYDELRADGRGYEANRVSVAMGTFLTSGVLDRIPGWRHLDQHRIAGIFDLDPDRFGPAPLCPFCGHGVYDQTLMGCDQCATLGEFTRTVPDAPLPKRIAPDLAAARRRVAEIERRALTVHSTL